MLKTIKAQILIISIILIILLLSQVFLSRSIRSTFVDSLDLTQEAVIKVSLVRELERDGLVNRKVYAEVPPRVEYSLTDLGRTLEPTLRQLCDWGRTYNDEHR